MGLVQGWFKRAPFVPPPGILVLHCLHFGENQRIKCYVFKILLPFNQNIFAIIMHQHKIASIARYPRMNESV